MPRELGRRDKPLVVFAEDFYLKFRTSDPANPAPNEMWGRSDLNSGDKVATLRWNESGTPYEEIPVFTPGTSGENVEEVLAMQTPNGEGYIPATSVSPTYSQLALQHSGETLGWHDAIEAEVPAIPDSVDYRFKLGEGSGSSVSSSIGSLSATLNGPSWVSDPSGTGGYWISLDGTDDWWVTDEFAVNQQEYTVAGWIDPSSVPTATNIVETVTGDTTSDSRSDGGFAWQFADSSTIELSHYSGGSRNSVTTLSVTIDQWLFVAISGNGDSGTVYAWDNSSKIGDSSGSGTREITGQENANVRIGAQTQPDRYPTALMDDWSFSNTTEMPESELVELWEATKR